MPITNGMRAFSSALGAALLAAAAPAPHVTRWSPAFDRLVAADAKIETIADGITWSEGPVWIGGPKGYLLFDDVPGNTMYRWSPGTGKAVFLKPSGFAGPDFSAFREAGANGLTPGRTGTVLIADSGNRGIARLDLATGRKTMLATRYRGHRFNSPNDLVQGMSGAIYFTDPSYGLKDLDKSPAKELKQNGVYRLDPNGKVTLIDDSLGWPNGIALSPDQHTLYVSNSDPARPVWIAYRLDAHGAVAGRSQFADASAEVKQGLPGNPDGMCIDTQGNLYSAGPGGLWVLAADGTRLGRIDTGDIVSNCAFGGDGRDLYITSNHKVLRLRSKVRGLPQ